MRPTRHVRGVGLGLLLGREGGRVAVHLQLALQLVRTDLCVTLHAIPIIIIAREIDEWNASSLDGHAGAVEAERKQALLALEALVSDRKLALEE